MSPAQAATLTVPKLKAETERHEEELEQLESCRAVCTDSEAIETLDAQAWGAIMSSPTNCSS